MAGSLGSLVVSLTAETAQFSAAMNKAAYQSQKNFNDIKDAAKMAGVAVASFVSVRGIQQAIQEQIDLADAMFKTSQKIGIATEELSKLSYAAKLSGVDAGGLQTAITKLTKNMSDAAQGTGDARNAFNALGINVKNSNGGLKSSSEVLSEVAAKFQSFKDGAEKTALAVTLFGKSGAELVPLLNQGADGIKSMGDELERLGGVINEDFARQAEQFNDNLSKLGVLSGAAAKEISGNLLPALNKYTEYILTIAQISRKEGKGFWSTILGLTEFGEFLGSDLTGKTVTRIKEIENTLKESKGDEYWAKLLGKEKKAAPAISDGKTEEKLTEILQKLRDQYSGLFVTKEEMLLLDMKALGATQQQIADAQKLIDSIQQENIAREKSKASIENAVDIYNQQKKIYEEVATPLQKLSEKEAELLELRQRMIDAGYTLAYTEDLIGKARNKANEEFIKKDMEDSLQNLIKSSKDFGVVIGRAFEDAIVSGRGFQDLLFALEQDLIRIIMRTLVTKPFENALQSSIGAFVGSFGGGSLGGAEGLVTAESPIDAFMSGFKLKAAGGPITRNSPYIVGEQGPEMFVPSVSGNIIPAGQTSQMLAGGSQTNISINISTPDAQSFRASEGQTTAQISRMLARARRNM